MTDTTSQNAGEASAWPGGLELASRAQSQVARAIRAMPDIFVIAFAGFAIVDLATDHTLQATVQMLHLHQFTASEARSIASTSALLIVRLAIWSGTAVAVHRFILLDERTRGLGALMRKATFIYAAWLLAFGIMETACMTAVSSASGSSFLALAVVFVMGVSLIRFLLVFPGVAIGARRTTEQRLRESWSETRGRLWTLVVALVIAGLIWAVLIALFGFVAQIIVARVGDLAGAYYQSTYAIAHVIGILTGAAKDVIIVSFGAAVASCAWQAVEAEPART